MDQDIRQAPRQPVGCSSSTRRSFDFRTNVDKPPFMFFSYKDDFTIPFLPSPQPWPLRGEGAGTGMRVSVGDLGAYIVTALRINFKFIQPAGCIRVFWPALPARVPRGCFATDAGWERVALKLKCA